MDALELIEKYYGDSPELKHVLITHSEQVRSRALEIADRHPELEIDREFVSEAAMLHDIGIVFCNAPKIYCLGEHQNMDT